MTAAKSDDSGNFGSYVIEHNRIQGLEVFLYPPIFSFLIGFEYGEAEIIICIRRQDRGQIIILPRFAGPSLFGYGFRVPLEGNHHRPCAAMISTENSPQELLVAA
ncbi:MAG TPA: hypothetical protein PKW50_03710 [Syntrophomonas sp.]|nr:hypothetical protein [Syntrophomonas sp.]